MGHGSKIASFKKEEKSTFLQKHPIFGVFYWFDCIVVLFVVTVHRLISGSASIQWFPNCSAFLNSSCSHFHINSGRTVNKENKQQAGGLSFLR